MSYRQGNSDPKDPRVRVEAARTLIDTIRNPAEAEAMELAAFMEIFHPGHKLTDKLVREARRGIR